MNRLDVFAPSGWTLVFNYTIRGPEHLIYRFPETWKQEYELGNYVIRDPVMLWIMGSDNATSRWSSVGIPDLRKVMARARKYGLCYGVAFTRLEGSAKSFLSMARSDREFTDEEIADYRSRFDVWVDLLTNRVSLTPGELAVLKAFKNGMGQAETAQHLCISESTVKQRFVKICAKLGASTRTQAVAMAISRNYMDE